MKNIIIRSASYDEAINLSALDGHDERDVLLLLEKAVEEGDDRAKYAIATWNLFGVNGVEKNIKRGVDMLKELKKSNIAEALFDLAFSYDEGASVRKNERKAFSLYMKAGLLGNAEACMQVSEFYREGKVVDRDISLSSAWKIRAECDEKDISPPYRVWLR